MISAFPLLLAGALGFASPSVLALSDEVTFGSGVGLVLVGVYLRWRFTDHTMSAEERAKDGQLSEEQVRFRIAVLRYSGPLIIILGLLAFVVLFWR